MSKANRRIDRPVSRTTEVPQKKKATEHLGRDLVRVGVIVFYVVAVAVVLMFHVHNQFTITRLGYEITAETREHRQLLEDRRKLEIEAAVVGRNDRMTRMARERFGLEPVKPGQVRVIDLEARHAALAMETP